MRTFKAQLASGSTASMYSDPSASSHTPAKSADLPSPKEIRPSLVLNSCPQSAVVDMVGYFDLLACVLRAVQRFETDAQHNQPCRIAGAGRRDL